MRWRIERYRLDRLDGARDAGSCWALVGLDKTLACVANDQLAMTHATDCTGAWQ